MFIYLFALYFTTMLVALNGGEQLMGKDLKKTVFFQFNPLNAELNPIRHLLALVGARHIVHVSRIRVKAI